MHCFHSQKQWVAGVTGKERWLINIPSEKEAVSQITKAADLHVLKITVIYTKEPLLSTFMS